MNLLKSENESRYFEGQGGGREDHPIPPEHLCDHDILMWRDDSHLYCGRRGEKDPFINLHPARANDISGPTRDLNSRVKVMHSVIEQLHRNFT